MVDYRKSSLLCSTSLLFLIGSLAFALTTPVNASIVGKALLCTDDTWWLKDELRYQVFNFQAEGVEYYSAGIPRRDKIKLKKRLLDYVAKENEIIIDDPLFDKISGDKLGHYVMTIDRKSLLLRVSELASVNEFFKSARCRVLENQNDLRVTIERIDAQIQRIYDQRLDSNKL